MTVSINNEPAELPYDIVTIADLVKLRNISNQGTAVALNNKLIKQDQWSDIKLKDSDQITIISAAFGG